MAVNDDCYDVFISYAHVDSVAVKQLAGALVASGLRVWFDESDIPTFAGISQRVSQGLAQSRAFLAYYSKIYPTRRACQCELTAAFVAAQGALGGFERLLVVNPEATDLHIQPIELRNTKYLSGAIGAEALAAGAALVVAHLATLQGPFGEPATLAPPPWYPSRGIGSTRFVGRIDQMWKVHSALNDDAAPFAANRDSAGIAQITGLGGVGKSLLAQEYALRFGAAYPAGIYWLRALGSDGPGELNLVGPEAARTDQLAAIAKQLGLPATQSPTDLDGQLRDFFQRKGQRGLWVVDDVPGGLANDVLRSWFAPHPVLKTLFTTRSREYGASATEIALGVLPEEDAYALLTSGVRPNGAAEESAARAAVEVLGAHALALDVAGAALVSYEGPTPFQDFVRELNLADQDALELAADLADALPNGHEKSIAKTLLGAIRGASEAARDVLRVASMLAAAPLPEQLLSFVPGQLQGQLAQANASQTFRVAARDLRRYALADRQDGGMWVVHPLIARAMRYAYGKDARTAALRGPALNFCARWLAELRARDLSAGAELAHARKLAAAGQGSGELNLIQLVASLDERRGSFVMAVEEWRAALAYSVALQLAEKDILTLQSNLAVTLRKAGDAKTARDMQTTILERRAELLGPKHPDTIVSLDNLGATLSELGDFKGAIEKHMLAMNLYAEVLGPKHPDTLVAMANLATAYRRAGEGQQAFSLNTLLLRLRAQVLGPDHPGTLQAVEGLAVTLRELGRPGEALPLLKSAADGLEQVRGPDDPTTLSVRHNLALALIETGQVEEGRTLAAKVLEAQKRVLGVSHPDTLLTLETCVFAGVEPGGITCDPRLAGDVAEALKVLAASMGPKHPRTTACAWLLYRMLSRDPKRRSEAVALVDQYLAWLLTAPEGEIEADQREVRAQFAKTGDGMFRLTVGRVFPGEKATPG
jgi:TIR domain/Tetratricopeptide repeat/NB-ARC domain